MAVGGAKFIVAELASQKTNCWYYQITTGLTDLPRHSAICQFSLLCRGAD